MWGQKYRSEWCALKMEEVTCHQMPVVFGRRKRQATDFPYTLQKKSSPVSTLIVDFWPLYLWPCVALDYHVCDTLMEKHWKTSAKSQLWTATEYYLFNYNIIQFRTRVAEISDNDHSAHQLQSVTLCVLTRGSKQWFLLLDANSFKVEHNSYLLGTRTEVSTIL